MGCLVDAGILNSDKTLTPAEKAKFINEVKELFIFGSQGSSGPFTCGEDIPPNDDPTITMENLDLEDESKYSELHQHIIKDKYEKFAASLDVDSTHSLLPALADPIALAGKFGVEIPALPSVTDFLPYFTGLLVPTFLLDLINAGVPDFVLPPDLMGVLPSLVSIPSPPAIPPLPVAFPPFPVELPAPPSLPGVPVPPSLPTAALSDLFEVDANMATKIPELLASVIADIPKLVVKIPNIAEAFGDICGKVKDSGIFGPTEPYEKMKKVYDTVLSRKLTACLFLAATASTIGVSPGSMGTVVAQNNLGTAPPAKPPATPGPDYNPNEKVVEHARSLDTISYGSDSSTYTASLFYIEKLHSTFEAGKVSIYGRPSLKDGQANFLPTSTPRQQITLKASVVNAPDDFSEDGPNSFGVENPRGFLVYADAAAKDASSCALFARACLYAGGATHRFFMSQYSPATAVQGLISLSILRNYKWIIPDESEAGKWKLNQELADFSAQLDSSTTSTDPVITLDPYQLKVVGNTAVSNNPGLSKFLKPAAERSNIYYLELQEIAKGNSSEFSTFPALDEGDILIIKSPPGENSNNPADEHAIVVEQSRPAGWTASSVSTTLDPPIVGIEGGLMDPDNKGAPSASKLGNAKIFPVAEWDAIKNQKIIDKTKYNNAIFQLTQTSFVKVIVNDVNDANGKNWSSSDVSELLVQEKPTAIRAGRYDIGYLDKLSANPGFYLGKSVSYGGNNTETQNTNNIASKRVYAIIKTKNFLKKEETVRSDASPQVMNATYIIDSLKATSFARKGLNDPARLAVLVPILFPSHPK